MTENSQMRRLAFAILFLATTALARVDHFDITSRTDYLGGKQFGAAGAYERIQGRAYFVVDPANAHDRVIVDLDKAPRNAKGEVEFSADIDLLVPKKGGNGTLFLNVPNRGGRFFIRDQNVDDYYLRQGYTLAEVGWQFDVR